MKRIERTRMTFPHISKNLDVRGNLFLCARYVVLVEMVDEKLVPPARPTAGKVGPRGGPVELEAVEEDTFGVLRPYFGGAISKHLAVATLRKGERHGGSGQETTEQTSEAGEERRQRKGQLITPDLDRALRSVPNEAGELRRGGD